MRTTNPRGVFFTIFGALSALSLSLSGCASEPRVLLESEPIGAQVLTLSGEELGVTPLTLTGEKLAQSTSENRLRLVFVAQQYESREVHVELRSGELLVRPTLTRFSDEYFQERFIKDFPEQVNELSRRLLGTQGSLFAKKLEEADALLTTLQQRYPNVAATHSLAANLELVRGNRDRAIQELKRATSLDPKDAGAARLLRQLVGGGASP